MNRVVFDILLAFPIVDMAFGIFWFISVYREWRPAASAVVEDTAEERALGASVIMGQLNAVITGSSIIVAGVGAFVALGIEYIVGSEKYHLAYSAIWAVLALGISMYTMGVLPTRTPRENFVRSKGIALLCAMALFFGLFAGIRFVFAIGTILLARGGS